MLISRGRGLAFIFVTGAAVAGCAAIWGFQDARDRPDGGADATTQEGGSGDGFAEAYASPDTSADDVAHPAQDGGNAAGFDSGGTDADGGVLPEASAQPPCSALQGTCVAAPPPGWQGPVAVAAGAAACAATAFDSGVYEGVGALSNPPAQCACHCGPPAGLGCGTPTMQYFSDSNCTQSCAPASQTIGTSCATLNVQSCGGLHYTIEAGVPTGSCAPDASVTLPSASWGSSIRLCGRAPVPSTGCSTGEVCLPTPGLPDLQTHLCVLYSGIPDGGCPPGFPASRGPYFPDAAIIEARSCTACTCGPVMGVSCSYTMSTFGSTNCSGGSSQVPVPSGCAGAGVKSAVVDASATGGSCVPAGGVPLGSVSPDPSAATTVCCAM